MLASSSFITRALMIAALCMLSACSVKTVYNNLDSLIIEYVDDMFTLDDPLESEVSERAAALIAWHREDQLDDYTQLLRELQQDFGPDVSVETLERRTDTLRSFWYALKHRLDEDMVVVLSQLDSEQRSELYASLEDRNRSYREDYVDIDEEERIESLEESVSDAFEDWLGDLTDEQQRLIQPAVNKMQSSASGRVRAREIWQREVSRILESPDDITEKQQALRAYLTGFDSNDHEGVKGSFEINRTVIATLTRDIIVLADEEQREHFIEKTDEYIEIFEELRQDQ